MGSSAFVAGAMIGSAIGGAIQHAHTYEMCMTLHGYVRNSD